MPLTTKFRLTSAALAGVFLTMAASSQAQSPPKPGVNLLTDPGFNWQTPTFQTAPGGPYAPGWTYTTGFDFFSGSWDLVSQSVTTTDLYYYDITFALDTAPGEPGVDFSVLWDGSPVTVQSLSSSDAWANYSFQVTAAGPGSTIGLVGNSEFWASLDDLDVSWTGGINSSPSSSSVAVPDSFIGFGLETALLAGLCGLAGFYRRQELRLALCKAA